MVSVTSRFLNLQCLYAMIAGELNPKKETEPEIWITNPKLFLLPLRLAVLKF